MPFLPERTRRIIDRGGKGAPTVVVVPLVQVSPGVYDFVQGGTAALELVDLTGTGTFETVAVGTSPALPHAHAFKILGTSNVMVY
jgi:hypothetical protein